KRLPGTAAPFGIHPLPMCGWRMAIMCSSQALPPEPSPDSVPYPRRFAQTASQHPDTADFNTVIYDLVLCEPLVAIQPVLMPYSFCDCPRARPPRSITSADRMVALPGGVG